MTKKDIMEWLILMQAERLESAKQEHESKIAEIRQKLFDGYGFSQKAAELEKLVKLASKQYSALIGRCNLLGLRQEVDKEEFKRMQSIADENMLDYLFSTYTLRLNTKELIAEKKRFEAEESAIQHSYFAVGKLMDGSKNVKETIDKLEELGFDIKALGDFADNAVLRGTQPVETAVVLPIMK